MAVYVNGPSFRQNWPEFTLQGFVALNRPTSVLAMRDRALILGWPYEFHCFGKAVGAQCFGGLGLYFMDCPLYLNSSTLNPRPFASRPPATAGYPDLKAFLNPVSANDLKA